MFKKCIKKVVNISCVVGLSILVNLFINNTCGHIDTNTIDTIDTIEGSDPQPEELYQLHFTKEDIERYKNYKEGLINEYGEEVYNLMNQEAGINNEEESFYHFIKYGI